MIISFHLIIVSKKFGKFCVVNTKSFELLINHNEIMIRFKKVFRFVCYFHFIITLKTEFE